MKQRCILLYAMPYRIEDNGVVNDGISLQYLPVDDLRPQSDKGRGCKGVSPCKQSISVDFAGKLNSLPGIYDVDFMLRTVQGKPTLVPADFVFISNVVLASDKREVKSDGNNNAS